MNVKLNSEEKSYIQEVLDILKASGVKHGDREEAKNQLTEHMIEARLQDEDFRNDLGSPQDFAMNFIESVIPKGASVTPTVPVRNHRVQSNAYSPMGIFLYGISLLLCATLIYFGLQLGYILLFTTFTTPGMEYDFHLFFVSDFIWWDLLVTAINIVIAMTVSAVLLKLLSKKLTAVQK